MKVYLLYILINVIHLFTAERAEASPHLGVLQPGLSHGSAEAAGVRCLRNTQGRCPSGQCVPRPWDQLFHWEGVRPQARRHDQDAIRTSVRHERNHVGLQGLQFVPLPLWWVPAEDYELDDLSYPLSNIALCSISLLNVRRNCMMCVLSKLSQNYWCAPALGKYLCMYGGD